MYLVPIKVEVFENERLDGFSVATGQTILA
jgi:hypothetical protein